MSYNFPPPVPMPLSVVEFLLHLLVQVFLLAAAFGVVPPCKQMSGIRARRRLLVVSASVAVLGAVGLKQPVEYFAAVGVVLAIFAIARLTCRVFGCRFSLVSGYGAMLLGVGLSCVTVVFPAYKLWYDSLWTKQPQCKSRLRSLGLAMHTYAEQNRGQLPDLVVARSTSALQSWRVALLPYLGRDELQSSYSSDEAWDAAANQPPARTVVNQFGCPANYFPTDDSGRVYTNHAGVTGPGTVFPRGKGMTLNAISSADGQAQTILFGECSGLKIVWTEPRDIETSKLKLGINLPGERPRTSSAILSSYHPGGAHVVFADVGVKFLSEKIDPKVLHALTTATGGESLPEDGSW